MGRFSRTMAGLVLTAGAVAMPAAAHAEVRVVPMEVESSNIEAGGLLGVSSSEPCLAADGTPGVVLMVMGDQLYFETEDQGAGDYWIFDAAEDGTWWVDLEVPADLPDGEYALIGACYPDPEVDEVSFLYGGSHLMLGDSSTPTPTATKTPTPSETVTPSVTPTSEPSQTPTPKPTESPSVTVSATPSSSIMTTASPKPSETASPKPSETASPKPSQTTSAPVATSSASATHEHHKHHHNTPTEIPTRVEESIGDGGAAMDKVEVEPAKAVAPPAAQPAAPVAGNPTFTG